MKNKMNYLIVFVIVFIVPKITAQNRKEVTLGVHDRIALLKHQIAHNIQRNRFASETLEPINNEDFSSSYEYENKNDEPITPIMDFDERKVQEKFKLRELKTTTEKIESFPRKQKKVPRKDSKEVQKLRSKRKKVKVSKRPKDIFYRRFVYTDLTEGKEWTHCQDLITPFITGQRTNITTTKRLGYNSSVVLRLTQLLSEDVEDNTRDDIYSIMFQISNLQIRLFQWDVTSIKFLLNTVNKEYATTHKMHTFRSVKIGLKKIFNAWHLDFTNTTNLLSQARIFRPPCVRISGYGGSTKTSRAFHYTKKVKPRCSDEDDDVECKEGY